MTGPVATVKQSNTIVEEVEAKPIRLPGALVVGPQAARHLRLWHLHLKIVQLEG